MSKEIECKNCRGGFVVTRSDEDFYRKMDVPAPAWCPDCRQLRRLRHVNELNLFRRKCSATGVPLISNHPTYAPYPVHAQRHWYGDEVDNTAFGRDFDFSRAFFEQYAELSAVVPRPALFTDFTRDENSEYTNYAGKNKNCYLIFDSDYNRDCMYSYSISRCTNSIDCYRGEHLELCFEALDSIRCYQSFWIQNCEQCNGSRFLKNCIGVNNSLFCVNLRQKSYYLFNRQSSEEEIAAFKKELSEPTVLAAALAKYERLKEELPERAFQGMHNENTSGNYVVRCKDADQCFDCRNVWDGKYLYQVFLPVKTAMDCNEIGEAERLYECANMGYNAYDCRFSFNCLNQITNLVYSEMCFLGCSNLFGCIGLKRKKYCVFNKQHDEEGYTDITGRIISHMKETGEWGQFFPISLSPFLYNHSMAQDFYPLSAEEALAMKIPWAVESGQAHSAPEGARECSACRKYFQVTSQEREFYSRFELREPVTCFHCRHAARLSKRAPRMLFEITCAACGATSQGSRRDRNRIVYCDRCFAESLQ